MMTTTTKKAECIRPINGILLLNKPQGLSSNVALQKARRLFKAKKAGHTGSLDPLATGMLPVCFGEATKLCQYLLDADKRYEATGLLGSQTTTGDSLGETVYTADTVCVTETQLIAVLQEFTGSIQQVPSMFSALKHKGQPLYKLARAGITIERKTREIIIDSLALRSFDGHHFEITVSCSKGTYIRNLIEDIGDRLGVYAHMTQLHRLYTAGFSDEPMYSLDDLEQMTEAERLVCLLPMERAIPGMPVVSIDPDDVLKLRQGKTVIYTNNPELSGIVCLHDSTHVFFGIGDIGDDRQLKVKRLLAF